MATSTFENPIITCTARQLAWRAWQTAQGIPSERQEDGGKGNSRKIFDAWWEWGVGGAAGTNLNGKPLVLTCLDAWMMGAAVSSASANVPSSFLAWWAPIVAEGATFNV
jgi:hypothetical protein